MAKLHKNPFGLILVREQNLSKRKIIIYGTGRSAEVVAQVIEEFGYYEVFCFTVDEEYKKEKCFNAKPLYSFEYVKKNFSPIDYDIFVSIGYGGLNAIRREKCHLVQKAGFYTPSIIHPRANLPSDFIYGKNCFIMNDVHIHPYVEIGENNFLWSGTTLSHHVKVGSNSWFTSSSMVAGNTKIGDCCFFGLGSIITNNLTLGNSCFVGAGALVSKNLANDSVVVRSGDDIHRLSSSHFVKLIKNNF